MTLPSGRLSGPGSGSSDRRLLPEHLYKFAGLLFLLALAYRYFEPLSRVLLIMYASATVAVGLNAVVRRIPLERRWTSALLGVVILAALAVGTWFGGGAVLRQLRGLSRSLPEIERNLDAWGDWVRGRLGVDVDLVSERTQQAVRDFVADLTSGEILGHAGGLIEGLALPLLVLIGGIFVLASPNDRLLVPLLRIVSEERRPAFRRGFSLLGARLSGWIKGLLISMVTVALLSTLSFYLLGVPYALLLGVICGLAEIVPIIGPWVGGIPAVIVAFVDDPMKGVWTALLILAIQQVESQLITPLVMSKVASVHPFITLFSIILFGGLFGFLGVLLALPLVLLIWTLVEVLWVERAIGTDHDRIQPLVEE